MYVVKFNDLKLSQSPSGFLFHDLHKNTKRTSQSHYLASILFSLHCRTTPLSLQSLATGINAANGLELVDGAAASNKTPTYTIRHKSNNNSNMQAQHSTAQHSTA